MKAPEITLRTEIRRLIIFFITALVLSGLTAFPVQSQLEVGMKIVHYFPAAFADWLTQVFKAVSTTNHRFPFLAYGTDWLAFAHVVIAIFFIGPLKDPVRNIWVIQTGIIACILVIPLALIAGEIRHIPWFWRFIDCSFGIIGIVPLYFCFRKIQKLQQMKS